MYICCPMLDDASYNTDIQIELADIYTYYKNYGISKFAILDAIDLSYQSNLEIQ